MFRITDFIEFDRAGRALCPSCQSDPAKRYTKKNLSLVPNTDGAYKCHKGCTPEQIRDSLGANPKPIPVAQKPPAVTPKEAKLYSRSEILEMSAVLQGDYRARCWLEGRGIGKEEIVKHELGLLVLPSGDEAIAIPYEIKGGYLVKYALVNWQTGTYQFRQPGISKMLWSAKRGSPYFLCEGEWDVIALAKLLKDTPYGVITGSNGAGTVPNGLPTEGDIYIFYDLDEAGRKGAEAVAKAVGNCAKICQVPYIPIDGETEIPKGYDVRDAIQRGATVANFLEAVKQGKAFEEVRTTVLDSARDEVPPQTNPKQLQLQVLRRMYAHRLRKNLRGYQVERDGKVICPDYLYLECLEQDGIIISKDKAIDLFNFFASENQYDPVAEYLNRCYEQYGDSTVSLLDNASSRYFHTDKPIYDIYLRKTLIGAVKRTFEPGCKFDTALVLFGNQGYGKSTFWRVLAGNWFDDTVNGFDQNEVQKLHHFWIEELGEIDKIQNKNDVSIVKAFLSRQTDAFRPVFERTTSKFPRKFIIVGSTNKQEILLDPTGDRRFWIIPITQTIDNDLARAERDQLWAAAVALYKAGEDCFLPTELEAVREQENQQFRADDPWQEAIADYCKDKQDLRTGEILTDLLQIPLERQDRRAQMRVADILRSLGWTKKHIRNGKIWEKPPTVVTVVSDARKQDTVSDKGSDYLNNKVVTNYPLGSPIENSACDPVTTVTLANSRLEILENLPCADDQNDLMTRYAIQQAEQEALRANLQQGDKVLLFNTREFLKRFPRVEVNSLPSVWTVQSLIGDNEVFVKAGRQSFKVRRDWLTVPTWEVSA